MTRRCTTYLILISLLALLQACHNLPPFGGIRGGLSGRLGGVDSLVNARPDSALTLLMSMARDTAKMSRRDLMRYYLLRTNAENKCDTVLTARHAALMRRVCDYYDRHTSPRGGREGAMLAHYLLGRCYDDMGEAPLALEEFHNAENAADTTIKDCDKSLILRIYGQSASIYLRQEAPLSALEVMRSADGVSRAIGDTIFLLINREQMAIAYDMLGMSDSVIAIRKEVAEQFQLLGMDEAAARTLAPAIDNALAIGCFDTAQQFARTYESVCKIFVNGRVKAGCEPYLYTKGKLLLHEGEPLKAEQCFRQLAELSEAFVDLESAYRGLSETYRITGRQELSAEYALKALSMNDSVYKKAAANFYQRMQASHKYSRVQQLAAKERFEKTHIRGVLINYILGSLVVICVISFFLYFFVKKAREHQRLENELQTKYLRLQEELQELNELREINSNSVTDLVDVKSRKIEALKSEIATQELQLTKHSAPDKYKAVVNPAINSFKRKYAHRFDNVTNKEWEDIKRILDQELPSFFPTLEQAKPELREEEIRVCILIRLQVSLKDIYTSMHCNSQNLSVMRKRMLTKLSPDSTGGAKDFDRFIMSLS